MNNYSDQQLPINFNNYNQFQNDESLHSSHPSSASTSSSSYNLTPDKQPNTIKERLNLHVKRKILENSVTSTATTTIGNCTVTSQQYQQLNQEKNYNNITKSPNILNNPSTSDSTNSTIPKRKRKTKKTATISAATTRSVSRTGGGGGNGDDSQDGNISCHDTNSNSTVTNTATTSSKNKDNKKEPDILAQILNQKKLALMRDPEIIELFSTMTKKLENNKNNVNQVYQS